MTGPPRLIVAVLIFVTVLLGCARWPFPASGRACPLEPVELAALGTGRILHAQVELVVRGKPLVFDVVAETSSVGLLVAGLAPHSGTLFIVRQTGEMMSIDAESIALEHVARAVMDALNRSFWAFPAPTDSTPIGPIGDWAAEAVVDRMTSDGRERMFIRSESGQAEATVVYSGASPSRIPDIASVVNDGCYYSARVSRLDRAGGTAH